MDLVWRVVVDFILQGRSMSMQVAIDREHDRICFHDEISPIPLKALRRWSTLRRSRSVRGEAARELEQAIENRDILELRRLVPAAIQRACMRIRIESQEANEPRSIHAAWYSPMFHVEPIGNSQHGPGGGRQQAGPGGPGGGLGASVGVPTWTCTWGPRASYTQGCTIVVTVEPSVATWLERTVYTHPILRPCQDLFAQEGRSLQSAIHATMTPMKHGGASTSTCGASPSSASMGANSPMMSEPGEEELLTCEVCYSAYPAALIVFAEVCGHTTCLTCATACSEKHVVHPTATLSNLQCPSTECEEFLKPAEVRAIVSHEDAMNLEMNEVRIALHDTCATCPKCGCSFQRLQTNDDPGDPKRFKFNCTVCETNFCVNCGHFPFHEDKPCQFNASYPLCRYCGSEAVCVEPLVCEAVECRRKGEESCTMSKQCGHLCHGKKGEHPCTSCLMEGCADAHPQQRSDDFCVICYCETLSEAPCIELDCGHVFHWHCLEGKIKRGWPTVRITFTYIQCPLCTKQIHHPMLTPLLAPSIKIKSLLESRYLERLKMENLMNCEALVSSSSPWYNQPLKYAEEYLTYYLCSKCKKPYFGGLKMCADVEGEDVGRDDLICGGCSAGSAVCTNVKHGSQYMEYKCRYCCNLAVWYCWGTTHFCDVCHSPPRKTVREECQGEEKCPLGGKHRPNGEEFAVGCAICRSEKLKEQQEKEDGDKK